MFINYWFSIHIFLKIPNVRNHLFPYQGNGFTELLMT